jgi:hypothetical protein
MEDRSSLLVGQPGRAWTVSSVDSARNLSGGIATAEAGIANESRAGSDKSKPLDLIVYRDKAGMDLLTRAIGSIFTDRSP